MIYLPAPDVSGKIKSGLRFSSTPKKTIAKGGVSFSLSIEESLYPKPLSDDDVALIKTQWAVNTSKSTKFPDCFGAINEGYFAVSKAIAEAIEELEPRVHQIVEIPHVWAQGDNVAIDKPYCFVRVCQVVPCVDMERSAVSETEQYGTGLKFHVLNMPSPDRCFVIEERIKGLHLWIDEKTLDLFISQDFYDRLQDLGCLGMEFAKTTSV